MSVLPLGFWIISIIASLFIVRYALYVTPTKTIDPVLLVAQKFGNDGVYSEHHDSLQEQNSNGCLDNDARTHCNLHKLKSRILSVSMRMTTSSNLYSGTGRFRRTRRKNRRPNYRKKKIQNKNPGILQRHRDHLSAGINLEQSSSSATGLLKSELLRQHSHQQNVLIDLTGGFGIDSYFMSSGFQTGSLCRTQWTFAGPRPSQSSGAGRGKRFLIIYLLLNLSLNPFQEKVDAIYIDPSRRKDSSQKVFKFHDCEPNVVALKDFIFTRTKCLMVKASPLMDLQQGLTRTRTGEWYLCSLRLTTNARKYCLYCIPINNEEPVVTAIHVRRGEQEKFQFLLSDEAHAVAEFSSVSTYLYEPNAAILKAGAFKIVGAHYALAKLHPSTHLYTSSTLMMDFPGRIFEVQSLLPADPKWLENISGWKSKCRHQKLSRCHGCSPEKIQAGGWWGTVSARLCITWSKTHFVTPAD